VIADDTRASGMIRHPQRTMHTAAGLRGSTLIELTAVIVVMATLAAVAAPRVLGISTRSRAALRMVQKDLAAARERAISTGRRTWVMFDTTNHRYEMKIEDMATPGKAGAAAVTDPATGAAFLRQLGAGEFAGVTLTGVDVAGDDEIGFDWRGKPLDSSESALATNGTITISNASTITIRAGTGAVVSP
jgi:Tfp pilus assembly protein FimT